MSHGQNCFKVDYTRATQVSIIGLLNLCHVYLYIYMCIYIYTH